jgi:hypothetical protein
LQGSTRENRCGPEAWNTPERRLVAWEHSDDIGGNIDNVVLTGISMGMRGAAINGLRARFCKLQ